MASFGKEIMRRDFLLDSRHAFINHGSFGTAPRSVFEQRLKLIDEQERQPDVWFRKTCDNVWKDNLVVVGDFLHAKTSNLVFVSNTTTGVNSVVTSLHLKEGDAVLLNQFTYGAVKNICCHLAQQMGFEVIYVEYEYPLKNVEQLLDAYDQALSKHPNIKLTIIDYISSMPTALLPVRELITVCRRHQTMILIDGAHSPGQVDLDLENLGTDFYIGNLHKWAFAPRGCAVLWVHPKYHNIIYPPVISGYYRTNDWQFNYMYQGTNDTTQFCCASMAVKYYKDIGDYEVISSYNTKLVSQAADMLVQKWNTEHYLLPEEMKSPYMRMVQLPYLKGYTDAYEKPLHKHGAVDLADLLFLLLERFGIQSVCCVIDGIPWVRISAMVYNCMEDYERLADAVLTLKNEIEVAAI